MTHMNVISGSVLRKAAIPALKWNPTQIHAQRHPSQARDDVCFSQVGHGFLQRELLLEKSKRYRCCRDCSTMPPFNGSYCVSSVFLSINICIIFSKHEKKSFFFLDGSEILYL